MLQNSWEVGSAGGQEWQFVETSRRKTAKSLGHGVVVGEKYMDHNSTHNQNERLFAAIPTDTIQA